jgi:hypothetical protein
LKHRSVFFFAVSGYLLIAAAVIVLGRKPALPAFCTQAENYGELFKEALLAAGKLNCAHPAVYLLCPRPIAACEEPRFNAIVEHGAIVGAEIIGPGVLHER